MAITDAPPLVADPKKFQEIRDLVERVRSGDPEAFEQILRRHEKRVLGLAVQMGIPPADAQDVCQEVFLRVFRYLSGFRAGRNFEVWLWRIAVNVVYDTLRRRRDRGEISWEGAFPEASHGRIGGLQVSVENADLCAKILSRMQVLSPQERMVFVLRELQDLDTWEVARAMRISSITVRRHGSAARRKLRLALEEVSAGIARNPHKT